MRLIYEAFADGEHTIYQTDDDGGNRRQIAGAPLPESPRVRRMPVYIEVSCDDTAEALTNARTALGDLVRYLPNNGGT